MIAEDEIQVLLNDLESDRVERTISTTNIEQNVLLEKIFKALNSLRMLIQSHPDAKSVVIPFINTEKYLII
jgi:hypothetical protein